MAVGAAVGVASLAVALWNPGDSGLPLCPSKALFGIDCPLCGATRAVSALVHGHVMAALDHNVLFTLAVPALVGWWVLWLVRSIQHRPMRRIHLPWGRAAVGVIAVLTAFTVLRNIDAAAWTRWLGADLYH